MTTVNEARKALNDAFLAAWGSTTPVTLDNESFDADTEGGDEWVRLTMRHRNAEQASLGRPGTRRFDRIASVIVQVYTRVDTGTERSDELVDLVKETFEGTTIDGVKLYSTTYREVTNKGHWRQVNVETSLFYEDKR